MNYVPTARFRGFDQPILKLYNEIGRLGWAVQSVDFRNNQYECQIKSPQGRTITRTGPDPATAVGNALLYATRAQYGITAAQVKLGMWDHNRWVNQVEPIARAYAEAPVYDPKAAGSWMELAHDSEYRAQVLRNQLHIEVVDDPEPYKSTQEMCDDVHNNKHFLVSRANSEHPLWTTDQNVNFRIVHDILGHCVSGGDFGWEGENRACAAHFPLLSPSAQQALFTECIGQTGYGAHYRNFGPQKVALLPQFMGPAQQAENSPVHTGIHPSQSLAPTSMPQVAPSAPVGLSQGTPAPHQTGEYGVWSKVAQGLTKDINQDWSSSQQPTPYEQGGNAFEHGGDPLDAFKPGGMMDTASKVDTGWSQQTKENGDPDIEKMKQAIVNAFRVVLLSPRKDLRWNAIHYQDISQIPANETDPKVYWDTLEKKRREWNVARGHPEDSHMIWYKPMERFRQIIQTKHPEIGYEQAMKLADDTFWEWRMEETHRIEAEDAHLPEDKRIGGDVIERKVNKALAQRLKIYNSDQEPKHDQVSLLSAQDESLVPRGEVQGDIPDISRYGAFMGTHLKTIAQISQHTNDILQAALQDVAQGGTGHIFRAHVLGLNISGVGPKVASFAWLLLQPLTSQLATIDAHMTKALGHTEAEMNPRDYFKFERELAARRDASGYGNVPLGAFQWGAWDAQRTGVGSHQDHSAMKVLDPLHHDQVDWARKATQGGGPILQDQPWWQATQPAADAVAREWDENVAPNFTQNKLPMLPGGTQIAAKVADTAFASVIPWFEHPKTGEKIQGQPGQTIMQHVRDQTGWDTPTVWAAIENAGKTSEPSNSAT